MGCTATKETIVKPKTRESPDDQNIGQSIEEKKSREAGYHYFTYRNSDSIFSVCDDGQNRCEEFPDVLSGCGGKNSVQIE